MRDETCCNAGVTRLYYALAGANSGALQARNERCAHRTGIIMRDASAAGSELMR